MKIDYLSDIHLNHWTIWTENQMKWEDRTREFTRRLLKNGNGEVLIIAGDFSEWNSQSIWILQEAAKQYERVYFTYGNHDLYLVSKRMKKKYGDSMGRLNELVTEASKIPNVIPLIKTIDEYKGKLFAGDAMWYLPKNLLDWSFYKLQSNDSTYIHLNGFTKNDMTKKFNKDSIDWYKTLEDKHVDVFVSHVPPIQPPISKHKPNGCYMVDVPFINANHWICGHQHNIGEFEKAGVQFHMNAIGYASEYIGHRRNTLPDDDMESFNVKTFEI